MGERSGGVCACAPFVGRPESPSVGADHLLDARDVLTSRSEPGLAHFGAYVCVVAIGLLARDARVSDCVGPQPLQSSA